VHVGDEIGGVRGDFAVEHGRVGFARVVGSSSFAQDVDCTVVSESVAFLCGQA
jgi:hypothetical protein